MLRFYYNKGYKYTNRSIIDLSNDSDFVDKDYENIDSPDTINGHIIYTLAKFETIPTYIKDLETNRRYFVSGITQLRTGKFQISLLRDIISEDPDLWKGEEAYIAAGTATDYNKYKRWDLPYTNTKTKEQRLDINGKSSFFVFYVNEQTYTSGGIQDSDLKIALTTVPGAGISNVDYSVTNLTDIPGYSYVNAGDIYCWTIMQYRLFLNMRYNLTPVNQRFTFARKKGNTSDNTQVLQNTNINDYKASDSIDIKTRSSNIINNVNGCLNNIQTACDNFADSIQNNYGTSITLTAKNLYEGYKDKLFYVSGTNKVYKYKVNKKTVNLSNLMTGAQTSSLTSALRNCGIPIDMSFTNLGDFTVYPNGYFQLESSVEILTFELEEVGSATTYDFTFSASQMKLPRSAVRCVNIVSDSNTSDDMIAQSLLLSMANSGNGISGNALSDDPTTGRIIDVQYLPFSVADSTNSDFKINGNNLTARYLDTDDYSFFNNFTDLTDINKETDTIKIVSPSRASQFLFRPYNNGGNMEFTTQITLRPYASIIYVRPSTQGLLINDWNDKDCLIINEDFSLTSVTSAWAQYIYNNKNYSNIFERDIQGREFERSWERRIEEAQKRSDDWTSRNISAAKAQTYTGNLPLISSVAGAIGTAFQDQAYMQAAQLDREYNEALYQEGINIARDNFNYQLDNVKSQPLIPSKITTLDIKNLDGIYLEFYSTNDSEKVAIQKYYQYNGNRIDAYGTFGLYFGPFVRGKIIISKNYTQPEVDELNRRLGMGIFTEVSYDQ